MCFGCIVDTDFLDSFFNQETGDDVSHFFRIPVHGTEHDHDALVRVIFAPFVIFGHDVGNVRTTNRSVGSTYHFDRKATEFFQARFEPVDRIFPQY